MVCGLPSYLGALGAFSACGARMSGIPLDDEGMRTDLLEQRLVDLRRKRVRPKLLYVVPDFQNPGGVTLSLERRHELLSIATVGSSRSTPSARSWRPGCGSAGPSPTRRSSPN